MLGAYVFEEMKPHRRGRETRDAPPAELTLLEKVDGEGGARSEAGARLGGARGRARREPTPARSATCPATWPRPTYLAEQAQAIAKEHGMKATVLGRAEMEKEGMGALLAVARGSEQEPRLIVLEHRRGPKGEKPLVLARQGAHLRRGRHLHQARRARWRR